MSNPTELIYVGDCNELLEKFMKSRSKMVEVKRDELKVKKGTQQLLYPVQEWGYYPLHFECKNAPEGEYIAGDIFRGHGIIKKC